MFGLPATAMVILQMALLANDFDVKMVMSVGVVASILWLVHSALVKDKWLGITNMVVLGFAVQGLL